MINSAEDVSPSVAGSVVRPQGRSEKPDKGAHFARLRVERCRVGFPSVEHLESEDRITARPNLTRISVQAAAGARKNAVQLYPLKLSPQTVASPSGQAGYGKRNIVYFSSTCMTPDFTDRAA